MRKFDASIRENGTWYNVGTCEANSMVMARNIIRNKFEDRSKPFIVNFGSLDHTHRVKKGCIVYEYDNSAICIQRV